MSSRTIATPLGILAISFVLVAGGQLRAQTSKEQRSPAVSKSAATTKTQGAVKGQKTTAGQSSKSTGKTAEQQKQTVTAKRQPAAEGARKLHIVAFGAHPDDCEIQCGGSAILWSEAGHTVRFVSVTNGDIGHWQMAGGPLARRRYDEVQQAAKILGTNTVVLDNHDGELMPTLENRAEVTRQIRIGEADLVIAHRPNDYHPDHRYTGVLVQDSAYMVAVPFYCPDTKPLQSNPVFMYYYDRFQKPNPFEPDIVVAIDDVVDRKLEALGVMESQFLEGGALGHAGLLPKNDADKPRRQAEVRAGFERRFASIANRYRDKLVSLYGDERGGKVRYAEAFEVCEYGRQPSPDELRELFPFAGRKD
jgi:LmbE family N-acetylglucosaminyl deacetylase